MAITAPHARIFTFAQYGVAAFPLKEAPIRQFHRYLSHRSDQLDYPSALAQDPPIGSVGRLKALTAISYKKRLKFPGSLWCAANPEHMLAMRPIKPTAYGIPIGQQI